MVKVRDFAKYPAKCRNPSKHPEYSREANEEVQLLRGFRFILIQFAIATLILMPTPAGATHTTVALPECIGDTPNVCSVTFELPPAAIYSYVDHSSFDELLVDGDVTLEWYDAIGSLVRRWTCVSSSAIGTNPVDLVGVCSEESFATFFIVGTQTLVVSANAYTRLCSDACTFQGRVRFYT